MRNSTVRRARTMSRAVAALGALAATWVAAGAPLYHGY